MGKKKCVGTECGQKKGTGSGRCSQQHLVLTPLDLSFEPARLFSSSGCATTVNIHHNQIKEACHA